MTLLSLSEITDEQESLVGGKAVSLARMKREGLGVPDAVCLAVDCYKRYVDVTGLRGKIYLELSRKDFEDMRWEEVWDAALRIRNMFLNTPLPAALEEKIRGNLEPLFGDKPVVVRSSAPGEDAAGTSFAGLHESYVNVRGMNSILEHTRKVWASLWADGALLYRRELGLDIEKSAMAVIVQEIVIGEVSGIMFGKNPLDEKQAVIEAVYGLNQGLVDGTIQPDRWLLDRRTGEILSHDAPRRDNYMAASENGVSLKNLSPDKARTPPLSPDYIKRLYQLASKLEQLFKAPQDMEWTIRDGQLFLLQARPITAGQDTGADDKRPWHLSLRRSYENLKSLRENIEGRLIPQMIQEADELSRTTLESLTDRELAEEIKKRSAVHQKWIDIYWDDFIPFAHGARLFGQVYNDAVHPEDPYEFTRLLGSGGMETARRNQGIEDLAGLVRKNPALRKQLESGDLKQIDPAFQKALDEFVQEFEDSSYGSHKILQNSDSLVSFILELASRDRYLPGETQQDTENLTRGFLERFGEQERNQMEELLDLARASYRLRDDDNIYLGRITGQLVASVNVAKERLRDRLNNVEQEIEEREIAAMLLDPAYLPRKTTRAEKGDKIFKVKARQLRGQPAGAGVVTATARVIHKPEDLFEVKAGEVLVCDSIDPNMTFAVLPSAGVVERRGGMLIHGAIIAREYGLPCVTGVPHATELIRTGDKVTVDGYLGIVTIL